MATFFDTYCSMNSWQLSKLDEIEGGYIDLNDSPAKLHTLGRQYPIADVDAESAMDIRIRPRSKKNCSITSRI